VPLTVILLLLVGILPFPNPTYKYTGEIWKKSNTNHSGSVGGEWKVGLGKGKIPTKSNKITVSGTGIIILSTSCFPPGIFLEIAPAMTIAPFVISPFVISFVACIVSCTPINALSIGFKVSARMPSVTRLRLDKLTKHVRNDYDKFEYNNPELKKLYESEQKIALDLYNMHSTNEIRT
jgi:hypothetical protein